MRRFRMLHRMATTPAEVFRYDLQSSCLPTLLRAASPLVQNNQPTAVLDDVRQLAQHEIAIHPVQGLAQCHQSEPTKIGQGIFNARVQPTNPPTCPCGGQSPSLLEHHSVAVYSNDVCAGAGKGNCDSAGTTTEIEDTRASGEAKGRNDVVQCRWRVGRAMDVIVGGRFFEGRGVERFDHSPRIASDCRDRKRN